MSEPADSVPVSLSEAKQIDRLLAVVEYLVKLGLPLRTFSIDNPESLRFRINLYSEDAVEALKNSDFKHELLKWNAKGTTNGGPDGVDCTFTLEVPPTIDTEGVIKFTLAVNKWFTKSIV